MRKKRVFVKILKNIKKQLLKVLRVVSKNYKPPGRYITNKFIITYLPEYKKGRLGEMIKPKVFLYIRVSTEDQATEGHSIDEQTERLHKYCEAMDWHVAGVYTDPGFSGSNIDRPDLKKLIKDVKAQKADKVVVYKLDRLSRSQKDTLHLIEDIFLANKTDFVSMSENFDTATPFGRAMIGILAVFAQLEREQIKDRLTMGREARAKKGLYAGSANVVIGYDYVNGFLVPNDYEAMVVNEVFSLFNNGVNKKVISEILNDKGYTHRFGTWNDTTIDRVLRNRHNIGEVKYSGDWYPGLHTPIVELATFESAQKILKLKSDKNKEVNLSNKTVTALGGFLWCGCCNARYHRQTSKKRKDGSILETYMCYSRSKKTLNQVTNPNCKNKIYKVNELDNIIFTEIKKLALDPEYLEEIKSSDAVKASPSNKVITLKSKIKELSDQISGYMDLYSLKRLSLQEVDAKIDPLAEQRARLEEELEDLVDDIESEEPLTDEAIIELAQSFGDILERGELHEIRLTINTLINKIEILEEDQKIYWNFS